VEKILELPQPDDDSFSDILTYAVEKYPLLKDEDHSKARQLEKNDEVNSKIAELHFDIDFDLSPSPFPDLLHDPSVRRLIHYYDNAIATTRAWVDHSDNPWRNTIIPLAIESPLVLYSVLAYASEHLCARVPPMRLDSSVKPKDYYRSKSVGLLSQALSTEVHHAESNTSLTNTKFANSILAALLILFSGEMVTTNFALWRLHLQAARIMIQRWSPGLLDPTSRFLVREAFTFDVFASSTNLAEMVELPSEILTADDHTLFIEYLQVVQDVTAAERRRYRAISSGHFAAAIDIEIFQDRFEYTRSRTMLLSQRVTFKESLRRDFHHVVEIYHHAGLIYSYQALIDRVVALPYLSHSLGCLFTNLRPIADNPAFAQDLAWPLFLAGTECYGKSVDQQWVKEKLDTAMRNSGHSMCRQALEFLQFFWASEQGAICTWIEFARHNESQIPKFMAFL
jgi:hypothetical protein